MQKFRRILVALDLSSMDRRLLQFLAAQEEMLGIEKAYFVHIMPDFAVPNNVEVEFQKLFAPEYPVDEKVQDKIGFDIQETFGENTALECSINVIEGKPYEKLLHWVDVKEVELLVVGKKEVSEGSGVTAKRVARNVQCDVLFVPSNSPLDISNIIVPMDFSDHSLHALQVAQALKFRHEETTIHGLYIVDLPPEEYYSRSKPGKGYRGILMESAQTAYKSFIKDHRLSEESFTMNFVENTRSDIASHIQQFALEKEGSLIVMGARGHSPFETFLFGSVTEKLAERIKGAPLLIVRKKT